MKVQINSVSLIGTERKVEFEPGLNIITGPITTGKTILLNLCRVDHISVRFKPAGTGEASNMPGDEFDGELTYGQTMMKAIERALSAARDNVYESGV